MGDHLKSSNMLPHNVDLLGKSNMVMNNGTDNNITSTTIRMTNASTPKAPNTTLVPETIPACDWILYEEIGHSR